MRLTIVRKRWHSFALYIACYKGWVDQLCASGVWCTMKYAERLRRMYLVATGQQYMKSVRNSPILTRFLVCCWRTGWTRRFIRIVMRKRSCNKNDRSFSSGVPPTHQVQCRSIEWLRALSFRWLLAAEKERERERESWTFSCFENEWFGFITAQTAFCHCIFSIYHCTFCVPLHCASKCVISASPMLTSVYSIVTVHSAIAVARAWLWTTGRVFSVKRTGVSS